MAPQKTTRGSSPTIRACILSTLTLSAACLAPFITSCSSKPTPRYSPPLVALPAVVIPPTAAAPTITHTKPKIVAPTATKVAPKPTYTPPVSTPLGSAKTKDALGHKAGPKNFRTVIIDPGHGGTDSGAVVNGVNEKTLALDIARKLKSKLSGSFKTIMLRDTDKYIGLDGRVNLSNKYDDAVLVSIHLNYVSSSSVRGPETYYFRVDSYSIAKRMQRAMEAVSPVDNARGLVRRRLRLTRNPQIPSVLVEIGYLSNGSERHLLSQSSYRDRMASALAKALIDQKKYGDAGMGKLPAPLNRPLSRPSDSSSL